MNITHTNMRTAFLSFINENGPKLKEKNPDIGFVEYNKILSTEWKELSSEEKKRFFQLAEDHNTAEANKKRVLQQIVNHMKAEIVSTFMNGDIEVKPPQDPIFEAFVYIDQVKDLIKAAAGNMYMYEGYRSGLKGIDEDRCRDYLHDIIPYRKITKYMSDL